MKHEIKEYNVVGKGPMQVSKANIVTIGGRHYLKNDRSNVVLVYSGKLGRKRYYRKTSKSIINSREFGWMIKNECFYCHRSKDYYPKNGLSSGIVDGKTYLSEYLCYVRDVAYLRDDPNVIYDSLNGQHQLKKDCVKLYGLKSETEKYTLKSGHVDQAYELVEIAHTGAYSDKGRCHKAMSPEGDIFYINSAYVNQNIPPGGTKRYVFLNFRKTYEGDFGKAELAYFIGSEYEWSVAKRNYTYHPSGRFWIAKNKWDKAIAQHDDWKNNFAKREIERGIIRCNDNYDDKGPDENNIEDTCIDQKMKIPHGGQLRDDYRPDIIISPTANGLGGMNYTNGIEIETAFGFLTDEEVKQIGWATVGDNSIRGQEYITCPLHGDRGLKYLERGLKLIASKCAVDNSCSVHVHVGGAKHPKVSIPSFTRLFSKHAIMLGTQIEEELFMTQPPSRSPFKKHCSSIVYRDGRYGYNFTPIKANKEGLKYLSQFVFGHPEGFQGGRDNTRTVRGRWVRERYRWLNLINCNTKAPIETIELRIFAGTTNYHKVLQAIRITNAFVWFAENRAGQIDRGGVTLKHMVEEAYKGHPSVLREVTEYIETRSKKFKRNIYNKAK